MNSWQTLLLLDMARGRYLSRRQATQYEWLTLWALAHEAYPTPVLWVSG